MPSSTATSTASAVAGLVTDAHGRTESTSPTRAEVGPSPSRALSHHGDGRHAHRPPGHLVECIHAPTSVEEPPTAHVWLACALMRTSWLSAPSAAARRQAAVQRSFAALAVTAVLTQVRGRSRRRLRPPPARARVAASRGATRSVTGALASFYRPPRPAPLRPGRHDHPQPGSDPPIRPSHQGPGPTACSSTRRRIPVATWRSPGSWWFPAGDPAAGWLPDRELGPRDHRRGQRLRPVGHRHLDHPRPGRAPEAPATSWPPPTTAASAHPASTPTSWARARPRTCSTRLGRHGRWSVTRRSNEVAVLGFSQGGQAALFAGEVAPTYAPELFVAGVAAVAPVTSVLDLAPTGEQAAAVRPVGVHRHGPLRVGPPLPDLRAPERADPGRARRPVGGVHVLRRRRGLALRRGVPGPGSSSPDGRTTPPSRRPIGPTSRASSPTSAPILVVQGTADEVVPFEPDHPVRRVDSSAMTSTTRSTTWLEHGPRARPDPRPVDDADQPLAAGPLRRRSDRRLLPPARARDHQVPLTCRTGVDSAVSPDGRR